MSPVLSKYLCSNGTTSGDDPNNKNEKKNMKSIIVNLMF